MTNLKMKKEFKVIAELLPNNSKVLDVGCGDGSLMNFLEKEKNIIVRGLELNQDNVQQCIHKGLSVIQGNAETELNQFPNQSFDYVVLSQTLQAFYDPEKVLKDLLRIGKSVVISIPNFGYWKVRTNLLLFGKMPVTKTLPNKWYDTPNLHMCTIKDLFNFCDEKNIKIKSSYNIAGISFSPEEIFNEITKFVPKFKIIYSPDFRQKIADSWPHSINDNDAKNDWGWKAGYDLQNMTKDMIKNLKLKYHTQNIYE